MSLALSAYSRELVLYKTPGLEGQFIILETQADSNGLFSATDLYVCNTMTVQPVSNGVALNLGDIIFYRTQKRKNNTNSVANVSQFMNKALRAKIILNEDDRIIFHDKIMKPSTFLNDANHLLKKYPITTNGVVIPRLND